MLFLVAFLTAFMLNHNYRRMMSRPQVDRPTYHRLLELRKQAINDGLVVVIENPATFMRPGANLFRFYLGLDAVTMRDWYQTEEPVQGNFLYFPDQENPLAHAEDYLLGKPCLKLSQMPPSGSDPSG